MSSREWDCCNGVGFLPCHRGTIWDRRSMLNLGNNIPPLVEERLPGPTRENQVAVFCPELAVPLSHSSLSYMGFPSSVFFSGSFFLEGGVDSSFFSSSSQSDYFKVFSCLFFSFFSPVSSSDEMALVGVLGSEKESSCSGQLLRNTAPVAGGGRVNPSRWWRLGPALPQGWRHLASHPPHPLS